MPVHNGGRYLREALESLLSQDYQQLEIIISDNASTDDTAAIAQEYAARDERVRIHRSEKNMGAVWNFNRAFALSHGAYFMWTAFDDLRAPSAIRRCVEALEARPDAALCCTDVRLVDPSGRALERPPSMRVLHPLGRTPAERVGAIARANFWYDLYGLIRSGALRQTRLAQPLWGFDVVLLLELCLQGQVVLIPEELFSYRIFPKKKQGDLALGLAAPDEGQVPVSWSNLALEMAQAISSAPLPRRERAALRARFLIRFCLLNHTVRGYLRRDIRASLRAALMSRHYRRAAALFTLAALIYPTQHRLGKTVFLVSRRILRPKRRPRPTAEATEPRR